MSAEGRTVGQAVPHESARAHVTGDALYTDDLLGRVSHLLHAWPVQAPVAHAHIHLVDVEVARRAPGVAAVLTAEDVPGEGDTGANRHDEPLFPSEVLFHGQPLAWVLADTLEHAKAAAALVHVQYEELPAILTIEDAVAAGSYLTEERCLHDGDMAAMARADVRVAGELRIGGQEHFYLETQCALAWLDASGGIVVESSTQHPSETQEVVARVLGLPRHAVTVECLRMGGAFGGKEVQANAWAAVAALGSMRTKRPVRVRLTRALDMMLTGKRHPYLVRYDAGFAYDGRLVALELAFLADGGWSLDLSEPILWRSLFHSDNAYKLPAVRVTGRVCRTHKTSQTAFRGFGGPQAVVAIEEIMSRAALRLGMPPEVVRERNFYQAGDRTHYGQPVEDADRMATIWSRLLETSTYAARRREVEAFNARHPHTKRGLAVTPVKFGISFTATFYNQGGALVLVYRDGTVQVNHGGTEMGQGLFTKIQQLAADALGVQCRDVRVMPTRTDKVPNTSATAASAGTDLNGAAVVDACTQLRQRITMVAAELMGCEEAAIVMHDGVVAGAGARVPFAEVCEAAYRRRVPLFAQGFYRTPQIFFDAEAGRGQPFHYFVFGAAVSEVEVDGFTGQYRLLRADILEDVGDSVSPLVDRGQIEGGFMQGVGWLTLEELVWDERGRLATAGASTYKLPSWSEVPETFNVAFLDRATQPRVVSGSKAVGEPPLMLAVSVREALRAAIAAFGDRATVSLDSPATPERVFHAIQAARAPE